MDSNQRRRKPTDLQSAPFSHSGTSPGKKCNYAGVFRTCQTAILPWVARQAMVLSAPVRMPPNATTHPEAPRAPPPETPCSQCASHHHNTGIAPIAGEKPRKWVGTCLSCRVQNPCCGAAYSSPPPCCAAIIPADCAHSGASNARIVSQICQNGPRKRPGAHARRYEGCRTVATSTTVTSKAGV